MRAVDYALHTSGFLRVRGHGVPAEVRARARENAAVFFSLPPEVKERYRSRVGGRGWIPLGAEANGYASGVDTPPDLKESFSIGPDDPPPGSERHHDLLPPNVWPGEAPAFEPAIRQVIAAFHRVAGEVMALLADTLGLKSGWFDPYVDRMTWGFNVNWYPPERLTGAAAPNQFRIGPHTDFGTITVLDRQPGLGGLQIETASGEWIDAPYDPDSLTINIADLLSRWTGDRWRSAPHRVLPPPEQVDESLTSLILFCEANADATINTLPEGIAGPHRYPPVNASDYIRERTETIRAD